MTLKQAVGFTKYSRQNFQKEQVWKYICRAEGMVKAHTKVVDEPENGQQLKPLE